MDNASDAMEVDAPPPPPAHQRAEMLACDPAGSLVAGTHYFLVEQKWFNTWTEFSTAVENAEPPGPIDNEPLLEPVVANSATADAAAPRALRLGQREGEHYHICTEAAWAKLHGWYGGGPPIRRAAHQASAWARNDVQLDLIIILFFIIYERRWRFDDGLLDRRFILYLILVVEIALEVRDLPPDPHVVRERE